MTSSATRRATLPDLVRQLTIAVIHFDTPEVLEECLARVGAAAPGCRVIVVEPSESEPSQGERSQSEPSQGERSQSEPSQGERSQSEPSQSAGPDSSFGGSTAPGVEVLRTANHSYAHAVNAAIKRCATRYLAFMNADVYVQPATFIRLVDRLADPRVAAVGPLVVDAAGRLQDQGVPYRVRQTWVRAARRPAPVPWLSGCLQAVRMEAIRGVGGMDATFRFYNEDTELGWRMRRAGWRLELVPAEVVHLGGNATPPHDDRFLIEGLRGGYALTRRTMPAVAREAHRVVGMLWAAWKQRDAEADRAPTFRALYRMFAERNTDASPFGRTLGEPSPEYWNEMS